MENVNETNNNVPETTTNVPELLEEIKEAAVEVEQAKEHKHVHSGPFFTQRISLKEKRRRRLANKRALRQRTLQRKRAKGKWTGN